MTQSLETITRRSHEPYMNYLGGVLHDDHGKEHASKDNYHQYKREARYFTNELKRYMSSSSGQQYLSFLRSEGLMPINLVGSGSMELPDQAIAATMRDHSKGVIVSNGSKKGFYARASNFARQYGLKVEWAKEYILAHELGHAHQKIMEEKKAEYTNEKTLYKFFTGMASSSKSTHEKHKYEALAHVAQKRSNEVEKNYGHKAKHGHNVNYPSNYDSTGHTKNPLYHNPTYSNKTTNYTSNCTNCKMTYSKPIYSRP